MDVTLWTQELTLLVIVGTPDQVPAQELVRLQETGMGRLQDVTKIKRVKNKFILVSMKTNSRDFPIFEQIAVEVVQLDEFYRII